MLIPAKHALFFGTACLRQTCAARLACAVLTTFPATERIWNRSFDPVSDTLAVL